MPEKNETLQVKANDFLFSVSEQEAGEANLVKRNDCDYHIIKDNRSVNARVLETDATGKKMTVEVEGASYEVEIKDELDQVLQKMGFGSVSQKHIKKIKAPMPGLVLEISVKEGQEVLEGEKLLILEAMKMENSIVIHANATIKTINIKKGQAVEKGQVLIELE